MSRQKPTKTAVVVSTGSFTDRHLTELRRTTDEASRLAGMLRDPDIGGFDVELYINSASHLVRKILERSIKSLSRDDVFLFYYSGHGLKDHHGNLYLATTDTETDLLLATAVSARFLNELLSYSLSRNHVVLLDCCFSGAFAKSLARCLGSVFLTATDSVHYAWDDERSFSDAVSTGIQTGAADLNGDGLITALELGEYLLQALAGTNQNPQVWAMGLSGNIVIAQTPPDVRGGLSS